MISKIFSWKTLHGLMMFLSWVNVAGRIPFGNVVQNFECHTYPFDKITGELVPQDDPHYNRLPWANREGIWAIMLLLGPLGAGFIICVIYILITNKKRIVMTS